MRKIAFCILVIALITASFITVPEAFSVNVAKSTIAKVKNIISSQVCKTFSQQGFGIDLGAVTNCYSPNGTFHFINSAGDNMSIAPLSVTVGGLALTSISHTTNKNSSDYDYSITGKVGGNNENIDMFVNNATNGYSKRIIVKWSLSIPSAVFTFTINNPNNHTVTSSPTSYCIGSECFDFSDIASIATLIGNTVVVTISNETGRFDPLAIDGTKSTTCSAANSCTSPTLTTASSPDIIWLTVTVGRGATISGVTSSPALTWTERKSKALPSSSNAGANQCGADGACVIDTWYAVSSGTFSGTVTATSTGAASCCFLTVHVFGISGADTTQIFDPNAAVPCTSAQTSLTPSCNITTSIQNDFIIGSLGVSDQRTTCTVGAGYTIIVSTCAGAINRVSEATERQIVSVTESGFAVNFAAPTCTAAVTCAIIGDAIVQATGIVQTKNCTFTGATSPTCQFASNVPVGDISVVGVLDSASTIGVTSVTDGAGNTYTKIIDNSVLTAVGDNTVYCSNVAVAGTLTVTANLGASASGAIILYDLKNAANNCATTGSDDSSGQNVLSTSPSVSSYTPSSAGLEIGFTNNACRVACTVTAGTGYTLDNNVGITAGLQASSESISNSATATTTPFTLSVANPWNEISVTFVIAAETTIIQPLTCTTDNSGTQPTLVLSGGNPSPATLLCNGISSNITLNKNTILTETVPTDGTNTRDRYSGTLQVRTSAGCASGTCTADTFTVYFQLQNTYQATPTGGRTTYDAVYTIIPTGTLSGTASTNICTITTSNGGGAVSCSGWADYNRAVAFPTNPTGSGGTSWTAQTPTSFTDTTGGNTDNDNYKFVSPCCTITNIAGFTLTYTSGAVSGLSSSASTVTIDSGTDVTVTGIFTNKISSVTIALWLYQRPENGIQIYGDQALTGIQWINSDQANPFLLFTSSTSCRCRGYIPPASNLLPKSVYNSGTINTAATFVNNLIDETGISPHEWDFSLPQGTGLNATSTISTTTTSNSQALGFSLTPIIIIGAVGVIAFIIITNKIIVKVDKTK